MSDGKNIEGEQKLQGLILLNTLYLNHAHSGDTALLMTETKEKIEDILFLVRYGLIDTVESPSGNSSIYLSPHGKRIVEKMVGMLNLSLSATEFAQEHTKRMKRRAFTKEILRQMGAPVK